MADALGTPPAAATPTVGVVSAIDHRLALAGLVCTSSSTALATRLGVMAGPGSRTILTGTSATGTMTVNVGPHHWVTTRGTADGIYLGTKETSSTVNIAAAPGANSRIDVVYAKQNDSASTISPDGSTGEFYGVVTGTAAASPTKPALPIGATEIGTVTVAVGATNTLGAGITISNTALQVVARGAPIPVRNQAERDALNATGATGLVVERLDTGYWEKWRSSGVWTQFRPDTLTNGGTSGVLTGASPPAGTPLVTKTWYGTLATNASGDATVTFPGGAFPNGLVSANAIVALAASANAPIFWVLHTPTLAGISARAYAANIAAANTVGVSLSIATSVTAIGW